MAKKKAPEPVRRPRRSVDQRIADLEARINAIKQREADRQAKADPALRNVKAALRAVDKALGEVEDAGMKRALNETRALLGSCLGGSPAPTRTRRSASELGDLAGALLAYVRTNPGQRGEQIAAALGTDTKTMRPVMKRLISDGKVVTEGQKRGMTYSTT